MDGKSFIWVLLLEQKQANKIEVFKEYQFLPDRKFRFDYVFYLPTADGQEKWAIEYEGIGARISRHTTITGYTNDTTKYNLAQLNGWRVLRYTAMNYKQFQTDLQTILINSK